MGELIGCKLGIHIIKALSLPKMDMTGQNSRHPTNRKFAPACNNSLFWTRLLSQELQIPMLKSATVATNK